VGSGATGVALRRVRLVAGAGVAGETVPTANATFKPAAKGTDAPGDPQTSGGGSVSCSCPLGPDSVGGQGGNALPPNRDGENGLPLGIQNKGTVGASCNGSQSPEPSVGASGPGAQTYGSVSTTTWVPSAGAKGTPGTTGQGGGGGAAGTAAPGNGGGGGGCGGCGGAGGGFGTGGGSSIALLAVSAPSLSLAECLASSSNAGDGGEGALGQDGSAGGLKGNSNGAGNGCQGATGSHGGKGGPGGGGAGGLSIAILYHGAKALTDGATEAAIVTGVAGTGGAGGAPGVNDGIAGVKQNVLAF
jgi:hypothetical protein